MEQNQQDLDIRVEAERKESTAILTFLAQATEQMMMSLTKTGSMG